MIEKNSLATQLARLTCVVAFALLLVPQTSAQRMTDANQSAVLLLSGHYQLSVNGSVDSDAKMYLAQGGMPRLLIMTDSASQPLLLISGEKKVAAVAKNEMWGDEADSEKLNVVFSPTAKSVSLNIEGAILRFTWDGVPMDIQRREAMTGYLDAEQILTELPEYRRAKELYTPGKGDLRLLGQVKDPVEVEVFFGSWCPHCEQMVPRLLSVMEQLENDNITFKLRGVPQQVNEDPIARQYKLNGIPTMIVRRGAKVVGRIEGQSFARPEAALSRILFGG